MYPASATATDSVDVASVPTKSAPGSTSFRVQTRAGRARHLHGEDHGREWLSFAPGDCDADCPAGRQEPRFRTWRQRAAERSSAARDLSIVLTRALAEPGAVALRRAELQTLLAVAETAGLRDTLMS
jgi:hypothetical protein